MAPFDGTPVLVPGRLQHRARARRRHPHVPRGRQLRAAQRPHARGRLLLRLHRPPGADRRRQAATRRTTWRSSAPSPTPIWSTSLREARPAASRRPSAAILASFGGTAFGDIALVPAPWLKHPKGIRDVAEWYMSTVARRDYVYEVFERQCEIALANLEKLHARRRRRGRRRVRHRHRFRHAARPLHLARRLPRPVPALPPRASTTGSTRTPTGRPSCTPAGRCDR